MLFILFELGRDRCAIDASQVVEILPLLDLQQIPHAPRGIAGAFSYRGALVPVVDLSQLALGRAAHARLSTRIVLVQRPDAAGMLGLLAERATQTLRREANEFSAPSVAAAQAPYLGRVLPDADGLIQWIEVERLLPDDVGAALQQALGGPGAALRS